MKRILVFSLAYYPSFVSGAEAAIKEITDRVTPSDIEFHLITLLFDTGAPRKEHIGNVHVHRVGFGANYFSKMCFVPLAAWKARTLHREIAFDALWSVMTYMLFPVVLAKMLGVRVPHVLTLQDGDPYEKVFERWFIRPFVPLLDWGFRNAHIVQTISKYLAEWPACRGYRGDVVQIPNGANPRDLKGDYDRMKAEDIKRKLGKQEGDVYLFTAARLVPQKGIEAIIEALPLLPKQVSFICVGGGPLEQPLKELAQKHNVRDRVVFVGPLDRSEVPLYRNRTVSDIFLYPSRSEGLGNSALSAMASRLPVIASQVGGLAEFIFDAKRNPELSTTAWAVDPDAPLQIAKAVKDILAHPEKVKEVTENARRMVVETYDWDKIAKRMRTDVFGRTL